MLLAEVNVELAESAEGGGLRAARAGEAQLRGRRRDDHRHATRRRRKLRLDRRAGDHRAQRARQPARGAAGDHRTRCRATLKKLGPGFEPHAARAQRARSWVDRALADNLIGEDRGIQLRHRDARGRPRSGPAHLPTRRPGRAAASHRLGSGAASFGSGCELAGTLDADRRRSSTSRSTRAASSIRASARRSRCRTPRARTWRSRAAPRCSTRRSGFSGVNSAAASVTAFEQALRSAQTALRVEPARPGGRRAHEPRRAERRSRTVHQMRRDLAQAYFNYLISVLRLKAAVGALTEQDLEEINRRLRGLTGVGRAGRAAGAIRSRRLADGASHAHSRSAAPRCAAMNAERAHRASRARGVVAQQRCRRSRRASHSHRATRSAAPASIARCGRFREVERVRTDERRHADARSARSGSARRAAAGCRRRTRRRRRRSSASISPIVSPSTTRVSGGDGRSGAPAHEGDAARAPDSAATSSKRCGWRGTTISSASAGSASVARAHRARAPPRRRASTRRATPAAPRRCARAARGRARASPSGTSTSNLRLPVTVDVARAERAQPRRVGFASARRRPRATPAADATAPAMRA